MELHSRRIDTRGRPKRNQVLEDDGKKTNMAPLTVMKLATRKFIMRIIPEFILRCQSKRCVSSSTGLLALSSEYA